MSGNGRLRILVLGATGMLGSTIFRAFSEADSFETFGTIRNPDGVGHFAPKHREGIIPRVAVEREADILRALSESRPDIVVNCVGIIKQLPDSSDNLECLAVNSVLPHRLAGYCAAIGARLIHFSTDCVFSGASGNYVESDFADANDLYGRTKYLGELDHPCAVTLRTSIIGHELTSSHSLIDWFLNQRDMVKGYRKAIFSGLPAIEIANVLKNFVIPDPELQGLYHLSVDPICKYDLLNLVADVYGKRISIIADNEVAIDRSLNSDRFRDRTGFARKPWAQLVQEMYHDRETAFSRRTKLLARGNHPDRT